MRVFACRNTLATYLLPSRFSANVFGLIFLIITCSCINVASAWGAPRSPSPSPAGGNYLALDGRDDYAVLDFTTFGVLLKAGTRNLTVEAWVYPTSAPEKDTTGIILNQQVEIYTVSYDSPSYQNVKKVIEWEKDDLLLTMSAHVIVRGGGASTGSTLLTLSCYQWHHIAFQVQDDRIAWICDNLSKSVPWGAVIQHDISKIAPIIPQKDFVLGGYGGRFTISNAGDWDSFAGYIDEVRISAVPRYDITKEQFTPQGRFEPDANTVALWHFDAPGGTEIFRDSSGNGYHLVGKNGATVGGTLAVNQRSKLTTTWVAIKSNGS